MKTGQTVVKIDSRNRITIPKKFAKKLAHMYKISERRGTIVLEPMREIPVDEQWLFEPKNKAILAEIKEALKQPATIDFDTIKKYLKK